MIESRECTRGGQAPGTEGASWPGSPVARPVPSRGAPSAHMPLARAQLCLEHDCGVLFAFPTPTCPRCGSRQAATVARFLDRRTT